MIRRRYTPRARLQRLVTSAVAETLVDRDKRRAAATTIRNGVERVAATAVQVAPVAKSWWATHGLKVLAVALGLVGGAVVTAVRGDRP